MTKSIKKILIKIWETPILQIIIPDRIALKVEYRLRFHRPLNLKNPITFNEKLQWLKLNDHSPRYTQLVDKLEVRNFVAGKIGEEYLIPLLGVYDKFDEIDFDKLPNEFVLKCTHDSGSVYVCDDKNKYDINAVNRKINKSLRRNYYYTGKEWPYRNVKPKIICEKYMVDESGSELKDYKFLCFNGIAKCMFVCLNRNSPNGLNVDFYDMDWNPMPFERHYPRSGTTISKPKCFDKMIKLAEKLSSDLPFVRVDFYETNEHIYFGELTLYPGSGLEEFTPESFDTLLGNWINLPQI